MRSIGLSDELGAYIEAHANPARDLVAEQLAAATQERFGDLAGMNIGLDQGRFMSMLVSLMGATTVVEVGTFTGMSALWLARGLTDEGRLICFDISDHYLETAMEAWTAGGVAERIEFRLGPAADGLAALPNEPHIDLAFIDADKAGYRTYLGALLPRMNERGVILVDNVLWSGRIVDAGATDPNTTALRDFNDHVAGRPDCEAVMLPVGDGLTLIRPLGSQPVN
jgi:caffeoyl-CoA O-methyltransferase